MSPVHQLTNPSLRQFNLTCFQLKYESSLILLSSVKKCLVWISREIRDQAPFTDQNTGGYYGLWTVFYSEAMCWLLSYNDVFISCLDSHSDGTHSLQRIHWWASDVMQHFSKSVQMKNISDGLRLSPFSANFKLINRIYVVIYIYMGKINILQSE